MSDIDSVRKHTLQQLVYRIIGPITPQGCSQRDEERLQNITELGETVACLVEDLAAIVHMYGNSHEHSVRLIADKARRTLIEIREYTYFEEAEDSTVARLNWPVR